MSKVWSISESSRGLEHSLAEAAIAHGDMLVATARNPEQLGDLVSRYVEQMRAVPLDVTNSKQSHAAVATAIDAFGRLMVPLCEEALPALRSRATQMGTATSKPGYQDADNFW